MKHWSLTCFSQGRLGVLAVALGLLLSVELSGQRVLADEARAALAAPSLVGEKRLEQMLIYARAMLAVDVPAGRQGYIDLQIHARRLGRMDYVSIGKFGESFATLANEGAADADRDLDEARRLMPATASAEMRCHAALMDSAQQAMLGRYGLAARSLKVAFEHAKGGVSKSLMADVLLELRDQLDVSAAGHDASADLREALDLYRAAGDRRGAMRVQLRQAEHDYELGKETEALNTLRALLEEAMDRGDLASANAARWALYGFAMRKNQHTKAVELGEQIVRTARQIQSKMAQAWALDAVAWAYIHDDRVEETKPFLKEALDLSADLGIEALEFAVVHSAREQALRRKDRGSVYRYSERLRKLSDPRSRSKGVQEALKVLRDLRSERQAVHSASEEYQRTAAFYRTLAAVLGILLSLALALVFFAGKRRAERMHAQLEEQTALAKQHDEARKILEAQAAQVERLDSLGLLAAGIAHDFNNILCGILGNAELLASQSEGEAKEHSEAIIGCAERASLLCNRMLDYAKPSARAASVQDLRVILDSATALLEIGRPANSVTTIENHGDPILARVERSGIEQVLINLVNNAHDEEVEASRVVVRLREESALPSVREGTWFGARMEEPASYAVLEVEDDGVGMQEEHLRRIFDPFYTTRFTGRGLGLSAAYGIVTSLGGVFQVKSTLGGGSTFRAWIPLAANEESTKAVEGTQKSASAPTSPQCVLVVDDEPALLALADRALTSSGHAVHLASSGARALEIYQKHAEDISAVFLDLSMPEMDGGEVLHQLRSHAGSVPIVMMSGHGEDYVRGRIGGHDVQSVLHKPFGLQDLQQSLELAVRPNRARRGLDSSAATG